MKIIRIFIPPKQWQIPVLILSGILIGMGIFVLKLSKATSYLSDDPETCINCHIMAPQYATWNHSSHREKATCNDCHVPHNNVLNKYYFKAKDGMRHATMFALRLEPQVIQIKDASKEVVQNNCIRCHNHLISDSKLSRINSEYQTCCREDRTCWECHREVPHGRINSLSSVPNARVPLLSSPVPEWIKEITNKEPK